MTEYHKTAKKIQAALCLDAASLSPDPALAQRVLAAANRKGEKNMKRKPVAFILVTIMMLSSLTALATVLLRGHDVKLYEGVELSHLLPDQRQEYDVCHRLNGGYLIGGFQLGDDYIASMEENDAIVMLDEHFHLLWSLSDPLLEGCLLDKVIETKDALFMGGERKTHAWSPAIAKLGKDGVIQWLFTGDSSFEMKDFAADALGNVYCAGGKDGRAHLIKLDENGQEIAFRTNIEIDLLNDIECINERIFLAGMRKDGAWIGEIKANGRIVWQKHIALDAAARTVRMQPSAEGALVLSVELAPSDGESTGHLRYYVIDVNSMSE